MELTPHEKKILSLVQSNPDIVTNPKTRLKVAKKNGLSEKTLRNRIGDLRKYGFLDESLKNDNEKGPAISVNKDDEIDLLTALQIVKKQKWIIIFYTGIFTIIGLLYGILATPLFQSSTSMYPAGDLRGSESLMDGNLGGLAESFGFGMLNPSPSYNIPDIVNSRRLRKEIVTKMWKSNLYPDGSNLIKFWEIDIPIWYDKGEWIDSLLSLSPFPVDPELKFIEDGIEKLSELISVEEDNSGLITVAILMEDPQLSSDIANYIAEFVKEFIKVEQHREAIRNKKFVFELQSEAKTELSNAEQVLTDFYKKNPFALGNPEIELEQGRLVRNVEEKQAVYITIRQQYEIAKIEEVKEKLFLNILDIAEPAVEVTKPNRMLITIFSFFFGFFSSTVFLLVLISIKRNN